MFLLVFGSACGLAALIMWWPHLDGGVSGAVTAAPVALGIHLAGAALFAIGAAGVFSRPLAVFYFVLVAVLPLIGMLTVFGLSAILTYGVEVAPEEEELEVGNPILARPSPRGAEVFLKPIAHMMREEDAASIGRLLLGLSKGGGAERSFQVLRRYQQDSDVELQFYAQSAQRGVTEGLERQLKKLSATLAEEPENGAVRAALSEVLIAQAGQRTTSSSDANAYVRRALGHLKQLPENAKRAALEVRGYLLLRERSGARQALEGLHEGDLRKPGLEMEVLYLERDWARLRDFADQLQTSDIQLRTARTFWRESA